MNENQINGNNDVKKCTIHAGVGIFTLTCGSLLCIAGVLEKPTQADEPLKSSANQVQIQQIEQQKKNSDILIKLGIISSLLSIPSFTLAMRAATRNYMQYRHKNTHQR